jgi:hypothetical protein
MAQCSICENAFPASGRQTYCSVECRHAAKLNRMAAREGRHMDDCVPVKPLRECERRKRLAALVRKFQPPKPVVMPATDWFMRGQLKAKWANPGDLRHGR